MASTFRRAQHGGMEYLNFTPSSSTFPRFSILPYEIRLRIFELAAYPNYSPGPLFLWGIRADTQDPVNPSTTSVSSTTAYAYAGFHRTIALYWEYNLSRSLSQTSQMARLAALKAWEGQCVTMSDSHQNFSSHNDGIQLQRVNQDLLVQLRQLIDYTREKMENPP